MGRTLLLCEVALALIGLGVLHTCYSSHVGSNLPCFPLEQTTL